MKSFILLITIIVLQNARIRIKAEVSNTAELGISPCMYSGDYDENGYFCPQDPMPVDWLQKECTSFIYDVFDNCSDLVCIYSEQTRNNMLALGSSGTPLYLYYGYDTPKAWMEAMNSSSTAKVDADNLDTFLIDFNVTGLILKNLNYEYDGDLDFHFERDFYVKLKKYVITIATINSNLSIGLYVNASNMIFYSNTSSTDWFDFTVLNDVMQYYIIGFDKFNPCDERFRDGIVPFNNVFPYNNSLTSFSNALKSSKISKEKFYLEFSTSPTINDTTMEYLPTCCVTYKKICESDHYNTYWCADKSDALYEKGIFARVVQARGIVAKYIDTIDPTAKCNCDSGNKFITFSMMLQGFLDSKQIKDCIKLNI